MKCDKCGDDVTDYTSLPYGLSLCDPCWYASAYHRTYRHHPTDAGMTDVRFFLGGPLHGVRTTIEAGGTITWPDYPRDAIYRVIRIAGRRYYLMTCWGEDKR